MLLRLAYFGVSNVFALLRLLDGYASHYTQHRPHRARNLRPPDGGN